MRKTLHPIQWLAAGAVTIFCLTGTAAFLGWLPGSAAKAPTEQVSVKSGDGAQDSIAENAPLTSIDEPITVAKAEPEPVEPAIVEQPRAPAVAPREVVTAPVAAPQPVRAICADCGTVVSIDNVQQRGKGSGVGAVAGGVVGGILGNQVGKGTGRDLATIAGAVIGGVAGHNVERNVTPRTTYRTTVELENGQMHSFTQDAPPVWSVGDVIVVPQSAASAPSAGSRVYEEDHARF